jgi:sugar lactone lactonase YvrE
LLAGVPPDTNAQVRRALAGGTVAVLVACFLSSAEGPWASISGGTQRWAASYLYGGPAFSYAVGVSPDGSTVFVSGTTVSGSSKPSDAATLAYDAATGTEKWVATYSSSSDPDQRDRATRLAVSPDGSKVFVTGPSACYDACTGSYFEGWSTVAYDALTGTELWVARRAIDGGAYSIAVSPDGSKVIVNGQEGGGLASATVAYDASTGEQLWVIRSDDAPVYWRALAVSPDSSSVFVARAAGTFDNYDYHTAAYDASSGTQEWSALYDGSVPTALALSPDGTTLFVTGYGADSCCPQESSTVAYDASTGTQRWAVQEDQIHVLGGDTTVHLAVSPDGSKVFVSGYDRNADLRPEHPFATVAYEGSSGNRLWVSRYRSGQNYPNDLAVSPDGSKVFVTGQETMPCYSPCTLSQINAPLVAYDASTGDELWVANYENNLGFGLAISPDGSKVYLAGTFTTSTATSLAATAREARLGGASAAASSCSMACGYSTAAYNSGPGPGTSQDRDPSVRYNGWRTVFDKTALGGAYRASRFTGDATRYRSARTRRVVWLTHLGPNQGKARVRIDGHSKGTFDLYSPISSARSFAFGGLSYAAHTVEVKVLGTKRASSTGTWVAVDGFKVGGNITVESSLKIQYDTWVGKSTRAASGGSYRKSGSSAARVSFDFTGTSIALVTATGPAYGRAKVVIDGVARTVDLYRRSQNWRVRIWYTGLSEGRHHISVRPLGTKHASSTTTNVVFDAFVVRS